MHNKKMELTTKAEPFSVNSNISAAFVSAHFGVIRSQEINLAYTIQHSLPGPGGRSLHGVRIQWYRFIPSSWYHPGQYARRILWMDTRIRRSGY